MCEIKNSMFLGVVEYVCEIMIIDLNFDFCFIKYFVLFIIVCNVMNEF